MSLFTIGNLSSVTALTAVLAGLGMLTLTQTASAFIVGGGYKASLEAYSFDDISATGTGLLGNANNSTSGNLNLGFAFNFFGVDYNQFRISSNGFLALGIQPASPPSNDARSLNLDLNNLNSSNAPIGPIIASFWDNLTFNGNGRDRAYYEVKQDNQGKKRLIVQWNKAGIPGTPGVAGDDRTITFQTVLFENSNDILLSYKDTFVSPGNASNNGSSATVGISDGSISGQRLQWSYNSAFSAYEPPQTGPTIRFRKYP
jgi:hypothetical protein